MSKSDSRLDELHSKYEVLTRSISHWTKVPFVLIGLSAISVIPVLMSDSVYFCFGCSVAGLAVLGPVGDYLGGTAGILLALAGVFFIYVSFLGQRQDLLQQQIELHQANTTLALQNDQLANQIFNSVFFNMINMIAHLIANYHQGGLVGAERLEQDFDKAGLVRHVRKDRPFDRAAIEHVVRDLASTYGNFIYHINNICGYVGRSDFISENEKSHYSGILLGCLSPSQQAYLACAYALKPADGVGDLGLIVRHIAPHLY